MKMMKRLIPIVMAAMLGGCASQQGPAAEVVVGAMPHTIIYKTNGDWSNLVPVNIDPQTGRIISFPDPRDIGPESKPIALVEGYLLDRRGVTENSRFMRYTYDEYSKLASPPSMQEMLGAIVPEAVVTEIVETPYRIGEGASHVDDINRLIRGGLKGCRTVYSR